jgi:hypothetical protein
VGDCCRVPRNSGPRRYCGAPPWPDGDRVHRRRGTGRCPHTGERDVWLPVCRLGPDQTLERRALAVANQIRRCSPTASQSAVFEFSTPHGLTHTVVRHLGRIERHKRARMCRRYTNRLHRRAVAIVDELAIAGLRDPGITPFLADKPAIHELDNFSMAIFYLADKRYKALHGIDSKLGT